MSIAVSLTGPWQCLRAKQGLASKDDGREVLPRRQEFLSPQRGKEQLRWSSELSGPRCKATGGLWSSSEQLRCRKAATAAADSAPSPSSSEDLSASGALQEKKGVRTELLVLRRPILAAAVLLPTTALWPESRVGEQVLAEELAETLVVEEPSTAAAAANSAIPPCPSGSLVRLSISPGSSLGVSIYPNFSYNPDGRGGVGSAADVGNDGRLIAVNFDPATLDIPPVDLSSTSFLGLPLPPPLRIDIKPDLLTGYIDRETGKVELNFVARFFFSAGPLYRAPPLFVDTVLTTELTQGALRSGHGRRLGQDGRCQLVGVARIEPVDDPFLSNFLMLPTDVLAELLAQFEFIPTSA